MILNFKKISDIVFDSDAVVAFKQGKQLQFFYNEKDVWMDWSISDYQTLCFGPWYHSKNYKWRVKPDEIEVEIERKVASVVKFKVEIPAPFKGKIAEGINYFVVKHSTYSADWWICECRNIVQSLADIDVKHNYVYFDKETAQKAVDILNGESK